MELRPNVDYIARFPELAYDLFIVNKRFTDCCHKEYFILNDRETRRVSHSTVGRVRQALNDMQEEEGSEAVKAKIEKSMQHQEEIMKSLSGIDQRKFGKEPEESMEGINTESNQGVPYAPVIPQGAQLSPTEVQALIENATLRNENRHLLEKVEQLQGEKIKLEQSGLAGLNNSTDMKFLQRDYADLKEKYESLKSDHDSAKEENEDLRKKTKMEEIAYKWAQLPGFNNIAPSVVEKLAGLIDAQAGNIPQLSGAPEDFEQHFNAMPEPLRDAFAFGVYANDRLSSEEMAEFMQLFEVVGTDKSQMVKVRNMKNKMIDELRNNANDLQEESNNSDNRRRRAVNL